MAIADDVAPAADRHVAGARVGRMMFTRFRGWFGHPMPATVVSCTVSIVSRIGSPRVLHEAADHLLLVTDRAYVDLGLARYQSPVDAPVVACAERTVRWPQGDAVLNLPLAAAVVRYRPNDDGSNRRSPWWRRTNQEWAPVAKRLHHEKDRLFHERGTYWSRSDLGQAVYLSDHATADVEVRRALPCTAAPAPRARGHPPTPHPPDD